METKILKGDAVKDRIYAEVAFEIGRLQHLCNMVPGIVFIGFEGVPLGKYNMPLHADLARNLGFNVRSMMLDTGVTQDQVREVIRKFNQDESVDAIVILQPVPPQLNPLVLAGYIEQRKEVEGFHPMNLAGTLMPDMRYNPYPMCLAAALEEIFIENLIFPGKDEEWVFLVDEDFLSNPLTSMIVKAAASRAVPRNCPCTFINRESSSLADHVSRADYLVVVSKHTEYVDPAWLKQGVCIIDIYSNLVREVPSKADPTKLVPVIRGGVSLKAVNGIAGSILPVPGGLMTVVPGILFRNALLSFRYRICSHAISVEKK